MKRLWLFPGVILAFGVGAGSWADPPGPPGGLPPGLEKNLERGKPLPPGWHKKLHVGDILDYHIYRHGRVLSRHDGHIILGIEDKRVRLIANTLEIVEILDSMD